MFFNVNLIYKNIGGTLGPAWQSAETESIGDLAWGDWDGDSDLDLAATSNYTTHVYENDPLVGGVTVDPASELGWETGDLWNSAVAWGDWDGDHDLDLAVGRATLSQQVRVYENEGDTLNLDPANSLGWQSQSGSFLTRSVAWGDWDNDGDLDLAVGNTPYSSSQIGNQVYENEGGALHLDPVNGLGWESVEAYDTFSVAWGDWDNDGDLDLAVGNGGLVAEPDQVYENVGGNLFLDPANGLGWESSEPTPTTEVAWGDWDGDGDLDLAVGNFAELNQIFENDQTTGTLRLDPANGWGWESQEVNRTTSVAWSDWDGDGDLDLAFGGGGHFQAFRDFNQLYENDSATGTLNLVWQSSEHDGTDIVAWGDWDRDGSPDLATAGGWANSIGDPLIVYSNLRLRGGGLIDNPPFLRLDHPIATAPASFYASPHIVENSTLPINYTLFDPEGDDVRFIRAFYSPNGGGQWFPATPASGTQTTQLTASPWPTGTSHIFNWHVEADLIKSDNVIFRLEAYPSFDGPGPYQWAYASSQTLPLRVEAAEWYLKVVDQTGDSVDQAMIYYDGQLLKTPGGQPDLTDRAGLLRLKQPVTGRPLVVLVPTQEQSTTRAAHDNWAYRTYLTNLALNADGTPQPERVGSPGEQRLTVRTDTPLILFNIVVSVEWDASDAYLTTLEDAFRNASAYLYDVTDGQMAFGQVTIYDKAEHWADADFQFSTKNTVRPYAFVGGITSTDEAHTIRVGRFWDGGSGNSGNWSEPDGYRTLIHEFGHYALYLYDSYFLRKVDENGNFTGQIDAFCTNETVLDNNSQTSNATIMFYQYNASELSDKNYNWGANCSFTEQTRLNNGEADWETVWRHYSGSTWALNTPASRGGVMVGPTDFPEALLPFPTVTIHNSGPSGGTALDLTVLDTQNQPVGSALVALYTIVNQETIAIDQGLTNRLGYIAIYGARTGDIVQIATFDGALAGGFPIGNQTTYQVILGSTSASDLSAQTGLTPPYLNMVPSSDGDTLQLRVQDTPAGGLLLDAVVIPSEGGGRSQQTALAYSPTEGGHVGTVSLSGVGLGTGRVRVSGQALPSAINSDYNLQQVQAATTTHLYAEDGNFELRIPPGGVAVDGFATVIPTGYVPGPVPAGVNVIGSAYEVRLSGAQTALQKEGLVRLHYHPDVMGTYTDIDIYFWEPLNKQWQKQGGVPGEIDNAWVVPANRLGVYALMGVGALEPPRNEALYLPVIVKP